MAGLKPVIKLGGCNHWPPLHFETVRGVLHSQCATRYVLHMPHAGSLTCVLHMPGLNVLHMALCVTYASMLPRARSGSLLLPASTSRGPRQTLLGGGAKHERSLATRVAFKALLAMCLSCHSGLRLTFRLPFSVAGVMGTYECHTAATNTAMSAALPTPIDCCQQNNCSSSSSGGGSGAAQWNITNVNPPAIGQGGTSFTGWINFANGGVWVYNGVSFIPLIL